MTEDQERMIEKVQKLLAKAENAGTAEEAETFAAKASELLIKWGIDDVMLGQAAGAAKDEIVLIRLNCEGIFAKAHMDMAYRVGTGLGFKCVVTTLRNTGYTTWVGWKSEVTKGELLYTSLMIQLSRGLTAFTADWKQRWGRSLPTHELYKSRREYILQFGYAVGHRLARQRRDAIKAAEEYTPQAPVGEQQTSVALVFVGRDEQVKTFFDERFGKLRTTSSRRTTGVGGGEAGRAAGLAANFGNTGIGSRKAIGT